ncbi:UNVERIFIED_CONTAM: hypothetical protein K2H54_048021 [Gekko kuhli]
MASSLDDRLPRGTTVSSSMPTCMSGPPAKTLPTRVAVKGFTEDVLLQEWAEEVFSLATNLLAQNMSRESSLQKA